ncbi:CopD family protein [Streptomyces sp. NPDC050560]|uniref:CopD family protein n=1 Tax=Streptomyces sp. NPDC050560 TaxID=3365630 RepID=UPI0037A89A35
MISDAPRATGGRAAVAAGSAAADRGGARRGVAAVLLLAAATGVLLLGPSAATRGTGEADVPGAAGLAVLRAVVFCALCVLTGEACTGALLRGLSDGPPPRRWGGYAALAALPAALGLAAVAAGGNQVPHGLADVDLGGLYHSRDGVLALVEINALLVAGPWARQDAGRIATAGPPVALVVAEAFRAHPQVETSPLTGSLLTLVHLACAALWVGCLWQVLRLLRHGHSPGARAALLGRYARVAAVLLAGVAATGTVSALRRMPPGLVLDQVYATAYGRTLLVKLLLVGAAAWLALAARLRLRRAIRAPRAAPSQDLAGALAPARVELVVLGAVVALSALLTVAPIPPRW